jgi:hypothetical protein
MNPLAAMQDRLDAFDSGEKRPQIAMHDQPKNRRVHMSVEERLITSLLDGSVTMETACGSTSEVIAACLALGRYDHLPEPYQTKSDAWARLDMRQRSVVRKHNPTFRDKRWDGRSMYG